LSLKKVKKKALDRVEREVISYVLEKTGWNRSKAAKILNISYKTILCKIKDLDIKPPTV
jgi:DNA-binding NtrC family response regulator